MTNLATKKGTIAYELTKHQDEIFGLINQGKSAEVKSLVLTVLDSSAISSKEKAAEAKAVLSKRNGNLFLSCLMTYMTGMKVS